jgi:hypothetical protein
MTEPTTTPTSTTHTAPDPGPSGYRVSGSLPVTITVTAANPDDATAAVLPAVAEAFAGLPGVVLTPQTYTVGTPAPADADATTVGDTNGGDTGDGERIRYRVPVTVRGHLDLPDAQTDTDAADVAADLIATHLADATTVVADLAWAVVDTVEPISATTA